MVGGREPALRIVYIAGAQHCGSTLLDAVLGNAAGAFSLGEVGGFHRYTDEKECDCRRRAASCGPCQAVVARLETAPGLETYQRVSPRPLKERKAFWTVLGTKARAEYARVADEMFDAVATQTGATVLIDSSKNVGRAAALLHDSRHDVRVIHLVRDGRGYLRSKRRRAERLGLRLRLPFVIVPWLAKNLLLWVGLRRRAPAGSYLLCRYEDLVADPAAELERIGRFGEFDTTALAAVATGEGVPRGHLYEPRRRVDYRTVRLDAARLGPAALPGRQNTLYWAAGGFVSSRWGYARRDLVSDTRAGERSGTPSRDSGGR